MVWREKRHFCAHLPTVSQKRKPAAAWFGANKLTLPACIIFKIHRLTIQKLINENER
jgi:hypothetical protein